MFSQDNDKIATNYSANLEQYPAPSTAVYAPNTVITLGDMHGNAMKFLWELAYNGIIQMSAHDFRTMWELYRKNWPGVVVPGFVKDTNISKAEGRAALEQFNDILTRITIVQPGLRIRLLGDFIADRGQCDIMQLRLLKKLNDAGVKVEIVASNHDIFFLPFYAESDTKIWLKGYYTEYLASLRELIERDIITHQEVVQLIENNYLPHFKLLSYALDGNQTDQKITLFMHAPNEIGQIKFLVDYLNGIFTKIERPDFMIVYADDSALALAHTIDAINDAFAKLRLSNPREWQKIMITAQNCHDRTGTGPGLTKTLWNYDDSFEALYDQPEYIQNVVHGHIAQQADHGDNGINLDTDLGKVLSPAFTYGTYKHYCAVEPAFRHLPKEQKAQEIDKHFSAIQGTLATQVADMQKLNSEVAEKTSLEFNDVYVAETSAALRSADKLAQEFVLTSYQQQLLFHDHSDLLTKTSDARMDNYSVVDVDYHSQVRQALAGAINKLNNIKHQLEVYFSLKNFTSGLLDYQAKPDMFDRAVQLHQDLRLMGSITVNNIDEVIAIIKRSGWVLEENGAWSYVANIASAVDKVSVDLEGLNKVFK